MSDLPRVVVLVGPTAVGKTETALRLAEALPCEIVSLDSRQVYRGMDIGTAKPRADERARVPHHLVDIADPDQTVALPAIQRLAMAAIEGILARGHHPVLVGGTGQYVHAVVEGWQVPDVRPDPAYRAALEALAGERGNAALVAMLARVDPLSAERIDARNTRRLVRALEVCRATGRPFSAQRRRQPPPYDFCWLGLTRPRDRLYERIDRRVADMIERGLEAEVRGLLRRGYGFELPAMSGLGYGEWRQYLEGAIDAEEVARRMRRNTRRLVRAQGAWFPSGDDRIDWYDLSAVGTAKVIERIARRLRD